MAMSSPITQYFVRSVYETMVGDFPALTQEVGRVAAIFVWTPLPGLAEDVVQLITLLHTLTRAPVHIPYHSGGARKYMGDVLLEKMRTQPHCVSSNAIRSIETLGGSLRDETLAYFRLMAEAQSQAVVLAVTDVIQAPRAMLGVVSVARETHVHRAKLFPVWPKQPVTWHRTAGLEEEYTTTIGDYLIREFAQLNKEVDSPLLVSFPELRAHMNVIQNWLRDEHPLLEDELLLQLARHHAWYIEPAQPGL